MSLLYCSSEMFIIFTTIKYAIQINCFLPPNFDNSQAVHRSLWKQLLLKIVFFVIDSLTVKSFDKDAQSLSMDLAADEGEKIRKQHGVKKW